MASEFDPIPGRPVSPEPMRTDPVVEPRSGMGTIGILAGLAVAVVLGLLFWNMSDHSKTATNNTAPGVTTGSSTAPALPNTTGTSNTPAPGAPARVITPDANKTNSK